MTFKEFIDQPLKEGEALQNEDGSWYLPIDVVKTKLDELCDTFSGVWSTSLFTHLIFTLPDGRTFCSGSLDLEVVYADTYIDKDDLKWHDKVTRTLSGAASFDISKYYPNEHFAAVLKSLCVTNAVQDLGIYFGKGLNDGFERQVTDDRTVPTHPNIRTEL